MTAELKGWICPRCGKVHSPYSTVCNCPSPTITSTTTGINDAVHRAKMPSEEEVKKRQKDKGDYLRELGYPPRVIVKYQDAIKETAEWFRNRMGGAEK